jgi:hypothetical protein
MSFRRSATNSCFSTHALHDDQANKQTNKARRSTVGTVTVLLAASEGHSMESPGTPSGHPPETRTYSRAPPRTRAAAMPALSAPAIDAAPLQLLLQLLHLSEHRRYRHAGRVGHYAATSAGCCAVRFVGVRGCGWGACVRACVCARAGGRMKGAAGTVRRSAAAASSSSLARATASRGSA